MCLIRQGVFLQIEKVINKQVVIHIVQILLKEQLKKLKILKKSTKENKSK